MWEDFNQYQKETGFPLLNKTCLTSIFSPKLTLRVHPLECHCLVNPRMTAEAIDYSI